MNTTLSPILVQRFFALQEELIPSVVGELEGLSSKLEQVIRMLEWSRIETLVVRDGSGPGQPAADRCALASAFIAKAVLGLGTTRGLIERLQMDRRLRRICGFNMYRVLPSEATFSRAFDEFARSKLAERAHEQMIKASLGESLIGHLSRDSTSIEARERVKVLPGAKGYKTSWRGYKLHLDTACCGVIISAVLTGAAVHDSQAALPLSLMSAQRVQPLYELMDAAY